MKNGNFKSYHSHRDRSLSNIFPEIAKEWDYEKNEGLTPELVLPYSLRPVWWKTEDGREFQATIKSRSTNEKTRMIQAKSSEQSGKHKSSKEKEILLKENSLSAKRPDIAAEWDWEKNQGKGPDQFLERSGKKVWFRCKNGHSWETQIMNRTVKNSCCPTCFVEKTKIYYTRPKLAVELHPTKNNAEILENVIASGLEPVWWLCPKCNREYKQTPLKRSKYGYGCPSCDKPMPKHIPFEKSLAFAYPAVAAEWHPDKNEDLTPNMVRPQSARYVWWKCSNDPSHEWQALIHNRTSGSTGCPHCYKQQILENHNKHI